jgi:hypothetical protein
LTSDMRPHKPRLSKALIRIAVNGQKVCHLAHYAGLFFFATGVEREGKRSRSGKMKWRAPGLAGARTDYNWF